MVYVPAESGSLLLGSCGADRAVLEEIEVLLTVEIKAALSGKQDGIYIW